MGDITMNLLKNRQNKTNGNSAIDFIKNNFKVSYLLNHINTFAGYQSKGKTTTCFPRRNTEKSIILIAPTGFEIMPGLGNQLKNRHG
jgi:hypothetical protein